MVARKQRKAARCESALPSQSDTVVVEFRSEFMKNFNRDRRAWHRREYEYLQRDRKMREEQQRLPKIDLMARKAPGKTTRRSGSLNRMTTNVNAASAHKDTDFNSLPDYSPSIFTLDYVGFPEYNWKGDSLLVSNA
jgi:hypothetical protein